MTEQLKALAESAKGWNLNFVMNMTDEEPCEVGWKDEDGCFYPLITVDCENYFQPSGPLADYIAAANPERILALIAENERLRKALKDELAPSLLSDLVVALNATTWSSWQTTAKFNHELKDAKIWLDARKALGETK